MSEPKPEYTINGNPIERRSATVTMPVEVLRTVYQMFLLRNNGQAEVLVRLSDWQIVGRGRETGSEDGS